MNGDLFQLKVADIREELSGLARTIALEVPTGQSQRFAWKAGQHLTLVLSIDGNEMRRSYSISSSPFSTDPLRITVKRVKGGLVSNYLNDQLRVGDTITAMPPFGSFYLDADATKRRTHYFFGAGSGITPLLSMLHSVMIAEPHSVAHLAYGNRNADSILLHEELDNLARRYPERLSVSHILSAPSMWSAYPYWRKGSLDPSAIKVFIRENPPYAQDAQYYVCGPGEMNRSVKSGLMSLDVPANRIHMESFGGPKIAHDGIEGVAATATVQLNGSRHTIPVEKGETILDAARASGLTPPFSCQSGVCGACQAKLLSGKAHMRAHMALEDNAIQAGAILTCQTVATTSEIAISYDS